MRGCWASEVFRLLKNAKQDYCCEYFFSVISPCFILLERALLKVKGLKSFGYLNRRLVLFYVGLQNTPELICVEKDSEINKRSPLPFKSVKTKKRG